MTLILGLVAALILAPFVIVIASALRTALGAWFSLTPKDPQ